MYPNRGECRRKDTRGSMMKRAARECNNKKKCLLKAKWPVEGKTHGRLMEKRENEKKGKRREREREQCGQMKEGRMRMKHNPESRGIHLKQNGNAFNSNLSLSISDEMRNF